MRGVISIINEEEAARMVLNASTRRDAYAWLVLKARRETGNPTTGAIYDKNCYYFHSTIRDKKIHWIRRQGVHLGLLGDLKNLEGDTTFVFGIATRKLYGIFEEGAHGDITGKEGCVTGVVDLSHLQGKK